jgi:hypothetical protein
MIKKQNDLLKESKQKTERLEAELIRYKNEIYIMKNKLSKNIDDVIYLENEK